MTNGVGGVATVGRRDTARVREVSPFPFTAPNIEKVAEPSAFSSFTKLSRTRWRLNRDARHD